MKGARRLRALRKGLHRRKLRHSASQGRVVLRAFRKSHLLRKNRVAEGRTLRRSAYKDASRSSGSPQEPGRLASASIRRRTEERRGRDRALCTISGGRFRRRKGKAQVARNGGGGESCIPYDLCHARVNRRRGPLERPATSSPSTRRRAVASKTPSNPPPTHRRPQRDPPSNPPPTQHPSPRRKHVAWACLRAPRDCWCKLR